MHGHNGPPIGSQLPRVKWSRDRWRQVAQKGALRCHISITVSATCMHWGITRPMATSIIDHYWKFFLSVPKIGQYFMNFRETISNNDLDASHSYYNIKRVSIRRWVSNTSQKNEKVLERIQKKMMRARITLDWSQSNNTSCKTINNMATVLSTATYTVKFHDNVPNFGQFPYTSLSAVKFLDTCRFS